MANTAEQILEEASKELGLDKMYTQFFSKRGTSKFAGHCEVFSKGIDQNADAKNLCNKMVFLLEKIGDEKKKEDRDNYCGYLRYWLYDEIGEIHKDHSTNIDKVSFFKELIKAGNKLYNNSATLKCSLPNERGVNLKELKNRKLMYIYIKNYDYIKNNISSKIKDKCDKYSIYRNNISSSYGKYYDVSCGRNASWFSSLPDYFSCIDKHDPKKLLPTVEQCKGKETRGSGGFSWGSFFGSSGSGSVQSDKNRGAGSSTDLRQTAVSSRSAQTQDLTRQQNSLRGGVLQSPSGKEQPRVDSTGAQQQNVKVASAQPIGVTHSVGEVPLIGFEATNGGIPLERAALIGMVPDSSSFLDKTFDILKSEYFRHSIVGASIIGALAFLFFYFKSTPIISRSNKRGKKRKKNGKSYYEEYEEEFSRYESEPSVAYSEMTDAYLSYQPRRDSYY
ncbi:PIR protein [Plasmodium vivax]|uniref:VIR protein n=1 Tax=Plasmodium vivax TaxID=5855 RepID=A0A565A4S7_PLAVI|nr:PIR protein [Plasmodium vivax]